MAHLDQFGQELTTILPGIMRRPFGTAFKASLFAAQAPRPESCHLYFVGRS
jgi:hypothetical protein